MKKRTNPLNIFTNLLFQSFTLSSAELFSLLTALLRMLWWMRNPSISHPFDYKQLIYSNFQWFLQLFFLYKRTRDRYILNTYLAGPFVTHDLFQSPYLLIFMKFDSVFLFTFSSHHLRNKFTRYLVWFRFEFFPTLNRVVNSWTLCFFVS